MKHYSWKCLTKLVNAAGCNGSPEVTLGAFILKYPKRSQFLAALALSYAKWHPDNYDNVLAYDYQSISCGLCSYANVGSYTTRFCGGFCPLTNECNGLCCWEGDECFAEYDHHPTRKNASVIFRKIKRAYLAEYKRVVKEKA